MKNNLNTLIEINGLSQQYPSNSSNIREVLLNETLSLESYKPNIEKIIRVNVDSEILYNTIMRTPKSISYEGQILTGLMVIVNGLLKIKIEYEPDSPKNTLVSITPTIPYSTYIILNPNINYNSDLLLESYIEDFQINIVNNRNISVSTLLLLNTNQNLALF